jgi:peptidoglycan/xylan/chitin deacetylase (PgdA/CDA1 family)
MHLRHGNLDEPEIALTFDDGPDPVASPLIQEVLRRERVPATFFVIGRNVRRYPNLVRAMLFGGNEIGNHTETHPYLQKLTEPQVEKELSDCERDIERATGRATRIMRPPGMHLGGYIVPASKKLGYIIVGFTEGAKDFSLDVHAEKTHPHLYETTALSPDTVYDRIVSQVRNGAIILLHENTATALALPRIITRLEADGYRFVPISKMLRDLPRPVSVVVNPQVPQHQLATR